MPILYHVNSDSWRRAIPHLQTAPKLSAETYKHKCKVPQHSHQSPVPSNSGYVVGFVLLARNEHDGAIMDGSAPSKAAILSARNRQDEAVYQAAAPKECGLFG